VCTQITKAQNEAIRHGPLLTETVGDTDGSRESTDTVAVGTCDSKLLAGYVAVGVTDTVAVGTCDSKLLAGYVAVGVTDTVAWKVDAVGSMTDIVLAFVLSF